MADGTRTAKGADGKGRERGSGAGLVVAGSAESPRGGWIGRRVFPLIDHRARGKDAPRGVHPLAIGLVSAFFVVALFAVAFGKSLVVQTVLPIALACGAVVVLVRLRRARPALPEADRPPEGPSKEPGATPTAAAPASLSLVLGEGELQLERTRGERVSLPTALPIGGRFGITLVSNRKRDRLVAAITSYEGAFLFATSVSAEERRTLTDLFARSTIVGSDDHALDATAPDGAPVELAPRDFRELVSSLRDRDAACFDRILLTDQSGAPVILDGSDLQVRDRHFDLRRPLEWRSILFQESFGTAVTLYQGTWIRQGASEFVLVSLLTPSFFEAGASDVEHAGIPELDVMATRDQRLLQATATEPPPVEQRVAMDGLFVVPLRAVLDQAPRASVQPVRAGHP